MNQTFAKSLYPSGSYIITTTPEATFPNDHVYCNIGENVLDVVILFDGVSYSNSIIDAVDDELEKADIYINWQFVSVDADNDVYFDFEYELIMKDYINDYDTDYAISLTDKLPPADGEYYNLGGYARLQNHCAIIFTENLNVESYVSSITLHELCHLLGYWHSENQGDVMYPTYYGTNNVLLQDTVDVLYELHH